MSLIPSATARPGRPHLLGSLALPEDERAVPLARHQLCPLLHAVNFSAEQVDDAALMVSELVANAVTHAKSPYELRVVRVGGLMECQVIDASVTPVRLPAACRPDERATDADSADVAGLSEHGRGLLLVSTLSAGLCGWRAVRLEHSGEVGKAVYFRMPWPRR